MAPNHFPASNSWPHQTTPRSEAPCCCSHTCNCNKNTPRAQNCGQCMNSNSSNLPLACLQQRLSCDAIQTMQEVLVVSSASRNVAGRTIKVSSEGSNHHSCTSSGLLYSSQLLHKVTLTGSPHSATIQHPEHPVPDSLPFQAPREQQPLNPTNQTTHLRKRRIKLETFLEGSVERRGREIR